MGRIIKMGEEGERETLRSLVLGQLTEAQKLLLVRARDKQGEQVSRFVNGVRKEIQCSDSTLWKSLRFLREKSLVARSEQIALTTAGQWLVADLSMPLQERCLWCE
ncbi:MAG TPA: hypothetical protein VJB87_04365 [Candidatus Nanoarchaeia archaeon]|nr:hypothetical protein [Candidatus Nanoarchaeia archaeon]